MVAQAIPDPNTARTASHLRPYLPPQKKAALSGQLRLGQPRARPPAPLGDTGRCRPRRGACCRRRTSVSRRFKTTGDLAAKTVAGPNDRLARGRREVKHGNEAGCRVLPGEFCATGGLGLGPGGSALRSGRPVPHPRLAARGRVPRGRVRPPGRPARAGSGASPCGVLGGVLVVAKVDRLARNVAFLAQLLDAGVEVTFADMPEADRFVVHVMAAVAEQEPHARRLPACRLG